MTSRTELSGHILRTLRVIGHTELDKYLHGIFG
jgi:hypothetical protein